MEAYFIGGQGIDQGGVSREFLQVNNALFCLNIIIIKLSIIKLYCQVIWINNET